MPSEPHTMERLQSVLGLVSSIGDCDDIDSALSLTIDGLTALFDAASVYIALRDGEQLRITPDLAADARSFDDATLHTIMQQRRAAMAIDGQIRSIDQQPLHTETIAMPLLYNHVALGILCIEQPGAIAWSRDDLLFLDAITRQLGQMIDHARTTRELRQRSYELRTVLDTTLLVSSQLDRQAVLHTIIEQAAHLTGADGSLLYLYSETSGKLEVAVSMGMPLDQPGKQLEIGEGLAGRAWLSRQIEHIDNYYEWTDRLRIYDDQPRRAYAVLAVPLIQDEAVLGVIDLIHLTPAGRFTDNDITIARLFAAQAAIAINNARLYERIQQFSVRTAALARTASVLDQQGDIAVAIQPLIAEAARILAADGGVVFLNDPQHSQYTLGVEHEQASLFQQHLIEHCPYHEELLTTRSVYDSIDTLVTQPLADPARTLGYASALTVPLLHEGQLLGCMTFLYRQATIWDRSDIEILSIITTRVTVMVSNAQLYHQLHVANRVTSEFIATISHELRTPMGAILGYTDLLSSGTFGALPQPMQEPLARLRSSADDLLRMINQILELSRIQAQQVDVHREPFQPRDLLRSLEAVAGPMAAAKHLRFTSSLAADVPRIALGDVGKLRQMLINLLDNAIKFTSSGVVTLSCAVADDRRRLMFTVRDTGIGITPEQRAIIWEPFRQADASATRQFGGVGLGLVIVRRLADLMDGSTAVESVPGSGSSFTIEVPLRVPDSL